MKKKEGSRVHVDRSAHVEREGGSREGNPGGYVQDGSCHALKINGRQRSVVARPNGHWESPPRPPCRDSLGLTRAKGQHQNGPTGPLAH
jgi:hypothetical protein